jgi:DNA-3-methyladenine glycosylase II
MLVRSIISQQISMGAARAIRARLQQLVGNEAIKPEMIMRLSTQQLRSVGLSPQKASYLQDIAIKVNSGEVPLARLGRLPDEEVIAQLIKMKGIGRWTAQMFLIFSLGRQDVFPIDDLGVRAAIERMYEHKKPPDRAALLAIGQRWSPFASIGSWYCWRYLERSRLEAAQSKRAKVKA